MRVVHIISGLGGGGAEHTLLKLVKETKNYDHHIVVMSNITDLAKRLTELGAVVHVIDFKSGFLLLPYKIFEFASLLRKLKPGAVQTWMYHANLVGGILARMFTDAPIFWGIHHTSPCSTDLSKSTLIVTRLLKLTSRRIPNKIVYCSNSAKTVHELFGFTVERSALIFNGYDPNRFVINDEMRRSIRQKLSISESSFVIGFVGRYHYVKGIDILLRSISVASGVIKNISVLMVGPGLSTYNSNLIKEIDDNSLVKYVRLLGPHDNIHDLMSAFDILILPSRSEAFPNVLNEAMLCGIPCISADVGDASTIVGKTGWLVEPCSIEKFVLAILAAKECSDDARNWLRRRVMCRNHVLENFSVKKMAIAYSDLWTESNGV